MRKGSIFLACLNESFVYNRKSCLFHQLFGLWTKEWIYLGSTISGQEEIYIFIDEVQLIEEWEKSVNSYSQDYIEEYELFISGSSSRMLSGELATLLSGRYVQFPVYPFSYQEYTEIRHLEQNRESYMGYMNTGGIPELFVLPEKQEVQRNYLSALKDTILLKDIIQRYSIRDPRLLEDLFEFLVVVYGFVLFHSDEIRYNSVLFFTSCFAIRLVNITAYMGANIMISLLNR